MGKKYIIEIPDDKIGDFIGSTHFLMPYMMAGHIGHHDTGLPIVPYTEPDLEQVRKEAYQQGLSDAKEGKATCQYCEYQYLDDTEEPCKKCRNAYMNKYKPKAKEEQITKGDIVRIKSTPEVEILVTYADEEYVSGIAETEVDGNCEIGDQYTDIRICNVEKTGKHYDIVSVLQKMRES